MAKKLINVGSAPNDGTGDSLREAGQIINDNLNELYSILGDGDNLLTSDFDLGTNRVFFSNKVETFAELNTVNPTTYSGMIMLVESEGAVYYANAGTWHRLLSNNSSNDIVNYNDPLENIVYSGDYNDLRNKPFIPSGLTDLNIEDGSAGQVLSTDGTGNYVFRDIEATNVDFSVIVNKPNTIEGYGIVNAFDGTWTSLVDKPDLFDGQFSSLENVPLIATDINQLTDNTNLLFDGNYISLTNKPNIPVDISDLTDTGSLLSPTISYLNLTDKPQSFSNLISLSMSVGANIDEFSIDGTLSSNSTSKIPTEQAVKTYVDSAISGFTQIANFSLTTDTSGVDDVGVIVTTDTGGIRIDNATEIAEKLTLSATGIGLEVDNDVSISGNLTLSNNLINNLTLPSVTDTVATVNDITTEVANYLPLSGGTVSGNLTITGDLNTENLNLTGTGAYTFTSITNVEFDAGNQIVLKNNTNSILVVDSNGANIVGSLDVTTNITANSITLGTGVNVSDISNDTTLSNNSSTALVTENAIKTYVDNAVSGAAAAFETFNTFGTSTSANFGNSPITAGNYFQNEAGTADISVSYNITSGFTKALITLNASITNVTDPATEAEVALERIVNGGTPTLVKALVFPVANSFYGGMHFTILDTHGASAGDTVEYKLKNRMDVNYSSESCRLVTGLCGDTIGAKEVA